MSWAASTSLSTIAAQVFYLLNCRSLRYSVLAIGLLSNPTVFAGIGAVLLLQLAFVYLPVLNAIFGSVPLAIPDLLLAVLVGAAILPIAAVDKRLRARSSG